MIEKKIYYVWIGEANKPDIFYKCLNSWKENLKEYEIIEINDKNFDIKKHYGKNRFFRECWDRKLWAFVSDYIRVQHLYENGGIYIDTDVEIVKDISELFEKGNVEFFTGFESDDGVGVALFGTAPGNRILYEILNFYEKDIWETPLFTLPQIIKSILKNKFSYNLSEKEIKDDKQGIYIYRKEYFYPFLPNKKFSDEMIKYDTYAIHWWYHSWKGKKPYLFLKTKHLKGIKKSLKKIGIYFQIIRDSFRNKKI